MLEELTSAWQRGECRRLEDFLDRHDELRQRDDVMVRLVYQELCLRQRDNQAVSAHEYFERFPQLHSKLVYLFGTEGDGNDGSYPKVGEEWGDYQIIGELGRGAQGRVFLGLQQSLATRPQVLKISPCSGAEHLSLARLQHTHIVPIYAVHYDPVRSMRTLCMPYFGGTTLANVLQVLHNKPPWKRTGADIVDVLDHVHALPGAPVRREGSARSFLTRASYVQAICWLGANIADALDHAHERGLIHLDVKPDNILMAGDGQPMLLDFHLAQAPLRTDGPIPERLGGTVTYLSPEQSQAFTAVRESKPVPTDLDGRSDIFSLGLVLYEALGWALPNDRELERGWLHRVNAQVSLGLSDIVSKCLATQQSDRYQRGAELAEDLRRHLRDLPLRGVANRSPRERWGKWRRRRPHSLPLVAMLFIVLIAASVLGLGTVQRQRERVHDAQTAHQQSRELFLQRSYAAAAQTAEQGLTRLSNWSNAEGLRTELQQELRQAQRAQAAVELHQLAERVRFQIGNERIHPILLEALERACRLTWERRDRLLPAFDAPSDYRLPGDMENGIRRDLLDLAVLGADLRVRQASDPATGHRQALQVLTEAESALGSSSVLYLERRRHAAALELSDMVASATQALDELPARSAWEHEQMGRSLLLAGDQAHAADHLKAALELQPNRFWSQFYLGVALYRQKHYDEALLAFHASVILEPKAPQCYYNRGRVHAALNRPQLALKDYDRALEFDPNLPEAFFNRGILHYQAQRYREALNDLQRSRDRGADPVAAHYHLALVHLAQNNTQAALAQARLALQHDSQYRPAQEIVDRLRRTVP